MLKKPQMFWAATAVFSLGLVIAACSSSSDDDDDDDSSGSGGAAGGEAGSSGGSAGEGGAAGDEMGGQGGSDNAAGAAGGAGGAADQGGNGGTAEGGSGGTNDTGNTTEACKPRDTNKGGIIGPTKVWGAPSGTAPKYNKVSDTLWVPAQYEDAKQGEVAVMFSSDAMADNRLRGAAEKLMNKGYMPPTIWVFGVIDWTEASDGGGGNIRSRAAAIEARLNTLKGQYDKISDDPKMIGVAGQSTAGAVAVDLAYARPDLFGKVWGSSASFANFMRWLHPYHEKIDASNKDKIRFALEVGECDLVPNPGDLPAKCQAICGLQGDGCIDAVRFNNWLDINKLFAEKAIELGYETQLVIRVSGTHNVWTAAASDSLAYLWRPVMCDN